MLLICVLGCNVHALTSCLQAEVFSDLLMVTRMGEVKDAVTSEVHLESKSFHQNYDI